MTKHDHSKFHIIDVLFGRLRLLQVWAITDRDIAWLNLSSKYTLVRCEDGQTLLTVQLVNGFSTDGFYDAHVAKIRNSHSCALVVEKDEYSADRERSIRKVVKRLQKFY